MMAIQINIRSDKCNGYQCKQPIEYAIEAKADNGQSVHIPFCESHYRIIESMLGDGRKLKDNEDETEFFNAPRESLALALQQVMMPPERGN